MLNNEAYKIQERTQYRSDKSDKKFSNARVGEQTCWSERLLNELKLTQVCPPSFIASQVNWQIVMKSANSLIQEIKNCRKN